MENFELIEKYATGQLQGPEKEAFELQLQTNTSLQNDVALQKRIIEGIKNARVAELKAMLNQVPVTGVMSSGVSAMKIITGAVAVGAILTGTLFYFKSWQKEVTPRPVENEVPTIQEKKPEVAPAEPREDNPSPATAEPSKELKKKPAPSNKQKAVQPKIEVVDPTNELTKEPSREQKKLAQPQSIIVTSRIGVEINSSSAKYSFHYQFTQGKLILYGIFDNGLYEIIEVNGDTHSIFLYYKDNYYLLNEKQSSITPLVTIKDLELVKKLKEYRGR
jgi:hypothetical protein